MSNALPTVYIIRGPFDSHPSEKAYELNRQTGARIYWSGFYFLRPDGNWGFSPNESQKAFEFMLRRVRNYLASGLGKPLIIDGVHGEAVRVAVRVVVEAGASWRVVLRPNMPPTFREF